MAVAVPPSARARQRLRLDQGAGAAIVDRGHDDQDGVGTKRAGFGDGLPREGDRAQRLDVRAAGEDEDKREETPCRARRIRSCSTTARGSLRPWPERGSRRREQGVRMSRGKGSLAAWSLKEPGSQVPWLLREHCCASGSCFVCLQGTSGKTETTSFHVHFLYAGRII